MGLEVPVCSQRLLNVTGTSVLGMQLDSLEVFDVLAVEEHVSDSRGLLVHLEGMASEDNALRDDTCWVGREEGAHGDKVWDTVVLLAEK